MHEESICCETCYWWDKHRIKGVTGLGECRRNPPLAVREPDINPYIHMAIWPTTADENWCGEHSALARGDDSDEPASEH